MVASEVMVVIVLGVTFLEKIFIRVQEESGRPELRLFRYWGV